MKTSLLKLYRFGREWAYNPGLRVIPFILVLFALGLIYWRIVRGYSPPFFFVAWPQPPDWVQAMYSLRWVVRALLIAAGVLLLYLEWAGSTLSRWLHLTLENTPRRLMFMGVMAALLGSYFLQAGNMGSGDAMPHIGAVWVLAEAIRDGQWFPFWTNYGNFGSPFLQFYSPLYYYCVLFTNSFVQNISTATELTLFGLHILSGYAMYLYIQKLTGSKVSGFVAALVWSVTFYHYHNAVILGKLPTALFIYLWPLQYYLLERLIDDPPGKMRLRASLALTTGAMLWTHMLYGGIAIGLGCIYTLVRAAVSAPGSIRRFLAHLLVPFGAQLVGVLMAVYYVIPVFAERRFVIGVPLENQFLMPVIGLQGIFEYPVKYPASWFGGPIGNTLIGVSILALALVLVTRYRQGIPLLILFGLAAFLTFTPYYLPGLFDGIFSHLPFGTIVYSIKSAGSYLIFLIGPLTALIGVGCHLLIEFFQHLKAGSSWARLIPTAEQLGLALAIIFLADTLPLTLDANYKYPDSYSGSAPNQQPLFEILTHLDDVSTRIIITDGGFENMFFASWLSGHPGLISHIPDTPRSSAAVVQQAFSQTASDLAAGQFLPDTASLLFQTDVGYLITDASARPATGVLEKMAQTDTAILWRLPYHTPIIATSNPGADNSINVSYPEGGDVPVTITDYSPTATKVLAKFSLPQRAFVQLSYSAYPYQRVLLDGQPVTVTPTSLGLIGFWAEAGDHTVEVQPELSPLRKITLAISAIIFLAAVALVLYPYRQK